MSRRAIEESAGLYLAEPADGDSERFVALFGKAWARIPEDAKEQLLGYWRQSDLQDYTFPRVEYVNSWKDRRRGTAGECRYGGNWLVFSASYLDRMPENIVETVVAHELAHVLQHATGLIKPHFDLPWLTPPGLLARMSRDSLRAIRVQYDELHADATVSGWGFEMRQAREWIGKNVNTLEPQ